MNVTCPQCQLLLECTPAIAGQQVACPRCQSPMVMPAIEPPVFAVVKSPSRSYSRPKKDNTPLLIIGGAIALVLCIAVAILMVDELRFWNAKRHMKEELKEIDRQFQKADRDIKKAADDFERAMRNID
jgi:hypothetical protein